jgi:hypothetical protein
VWTQKWTHGQKHQASALNSEIVGIITTREDSPLRRFKKKKKKPERDIHPNRYVYHNIET